jgi:hypothetical protein
MRNKLLITIGFLVSFGLQSYGQPVNVQVNGDGSRYSSVLLNGSTSAKYDIVFVGDGFTSSAADQTSFNNAVNTSVTAIRNKHPYSDNICAFNVWRVNVISSQAGVDHPITNVFKNTELNCTFGNGTTTAARLIYSTTPNRVTEAANYAPAHDAIYVLVNDPEYGGAAGDIVYTSLNYDMSEVVVHELGHFTGHLADEYTCYFCDGRTEPVYAGPEPGAVNVTIQTNPALIKWRSFITAGTPIPTTVNSPAGVVGLWVGGNYSPTVVYRPQQRCLMKSLHNELCAVCNNALNNILRPYCTVCERNPGSLACLVSRLRGWFEISENLLIFRIPMCCFCPLDILIRKTEVELSINPKDYNIEITDGSKDPVKAVIRATDKGTTISYEENSKSTYFLKISAKGKQNQATRVEARVSRNGQQSAMF